MGTTKTRGVISVAQAEVPSSWPARLSGQANLGSRGRSCRRLEDVGVDWVCCSMRISSINKRDLRHLNFS